MQRRRFLGGVGASAGVALAGCTVPGQRGTHPFAGGTLSVRVDIESESGHDLARNAREALEYWDAHAERYVGFQVAFEVESVSEPDIVIEYVDEPSRCHMVENFSERVLGCAPVITGRHRRVSRPVTAVVVAGARPFGKIRITAKHEIGHILGLGHDDEPLEIMSNYPEHRIPLYGDRLEIWDRATAAYGRSADGSAAFVDGAAAWRDAEYGTAEGMFENAREAYAEVYELLVDARSRTDVFDGHPRVETVDLPGLRAHLGRLLERTDLAETFCGHLAAASTAAAAGDVSQANELRSQANEKIAAFHAIGTVEVRDIAITLGLVRGFERDEEFVDVKDEAFEGDEH